MIVCILVIVTLICGIAMTIIGDRKSGKFADWCFDVCYIVLIPAILATIIVASLVINSHVMIDHKIDLIEIEYAGLCEKVEFIDNCDANPSAIALVNETIDEVVQWNSAIIRKQWGLNSPWFNWFFNEEVVNFYKPIALDL